MEIKEILKREANIINKQNNEIMSNENEISLGMYERYYHNVNVLIKIAEVVNKLEIKEEAKRFMPIILVVIFWIFAMLLVIDYQKRCIEDLETRPKTLRKLQIEEIQTMIRRLQEIQNENFGIASKDTIMRNILNEYTAVYAEQKRKLDE